VKKRRAREAWGSAEEGNKKRGEPKKRCAKWHTISSQPVITIWKAKDTPAGKKTLVKERKEGCSHPHLLRDHKSLLLRELEIYARGYVKKIGEKISQTESCRKS